MSTRSFTFSETIAAPVSQVYRAFATAQGLQEWIADLVEADARPGGRLYLWWNAGFYASGLFEEAVKDESVRFTWLAVREPGETRVSVKLEPRDGGTQLTLVHEGLGEGAEWETTAENHQREWPSGLANLKSVLETGVDRRLYDRPMLGFFIGGLVDENLKNRLNLPIDYGIHVAGTIPEMGAARSGLKHDDVIAEVGGVEARTFQTLGPVLAKYKGGDILRTVIYRGPERMDIDIELSKRPVPAYPAQPAELAELARTVSKDVLKNLKTVIKGATEEETAQKPGPGEWSVKENLAHLLVGDRLSPAAWDLFGDGEKAPPYAGSHRLVEAIARTYTTKQLLKELKRTYALLANVIETAPDTMTANKAVYFLAGGDLENDIRNHWQEHIDQIKTTLAVVREAVSGPVSEAVPA